MARPLRKRILCVAYLLSKPLVEISLFPINSPIACGRGVFFGNIMVIMCYNCDNIIRRFDDE